MSSLASKFAEQLTTGTPAEHAAAAQALSLLGEDAAPAAAALVNACADDATLESSVAALEAMGPPTNDQIDSLATLAGSDEATVAYWAVTLLGRAGEAASHHATMITTLAENTKEDSVRHRAVLALGKIGASSVDALPLLDQLAESDEPRLSALARNAAKAIRG